MTKAVITACGDSAAIYLPESILSALNLKVGDSLDIVVDGGKIILTPFQQNFSQLDRLMNDVNEGNVHQRIDFGSALGKEKI